jgi:uncharacterized protein
VEYNTKEEILLLREWEETIVSDIIAVSALNVYPIKSCAGTALDVAQIGPRGIVHDRSFMLVDREGMLITQREQPRMALIRPTISAEGELTVQAPAMPALMIASNQNGPRYPVTVWGYTVDGIDQGDEMAQWFSGFLGIDCRLALFPNDAIRPVNPKYARSERDQVAFADGYPCLLISEASLADLNTRLERPLPMNRFRPNIVVSGTEPYAEDTWRMIRIGEVTFDIVKPCDRCVITTTDQVTTQRGKEPLKTLARYRQATDNGVMFGQNLIYANTGTIRVGDRVEIIKKETAANFALKASRA